MKHLKFYLVATLIWFFGFYNLERLMEPINLASFVYVLAAIYSVLIILSANLQRLPLTALFLGGLVPYFMLKVATGSGIAGQQLPLTVTEVVSLGITLILIKQVANRMETFRTEILRLTVGSASVAAKPFQSAQAECYREIRRSRHYKRPAALLSVAPSKQSVDLSINRFIQEAQNSIIHQYIVARTADLLRTSLKETDVVTMRDNHFLVLLPETETDHLPRVIERLQNSAKEKLGLDLKIGYSTFPSDALTFESLVDQAEKRMQGVDLPAVPFTLPVDLMATHKNGEVAEKTANEVMENGTASKARSSSQSNKVRG